MRRQFQCPLPSNPNNQAKLEQIRGLLPDVNTMTNIEQLNTAIATLRRDGMSKSMIIDHLVGAYCPMVVREAQRTDAEKTALVRRFTGQVTRLVYSLESGLDIIINVPLTPDVVDAVNSLARKQGLSGPTWIAMTIDYALQQQSAARRQQDSLTSVSFASRSNRIGRLGIYLDVRLELMRLRFGRRRYRHLWHHPQRQRAQLLPRRILDLDTRFSGGAEERFFAAMPSLW